MDLNGFLYKWVIGSKTLDTVHDCFLKECVTVRYITSSTSVYGIRERLSTSRTWMLTLAFNILKCVYLWTKAMKKLTGNLIEEDRPFPHSSQARARKHESEARVDKLQTWRTTPRSLRRKLRKISRGVSLLKLTSVYKERDRRTPEQ